MKKYIAVEAESNYKHDCVTSFKRISDKNIKRILKIKDIIKDNNGYWYDSHWSKDNDLEKFYLNKLTSDDIAFFNNYIPYHLDGISKITYITIYKIIGKQTHRVMR